MSDPRDILGDRDPNVPDRPTRVAEPSREKSLPKRFYKQVTTQESDDGLHAVLLDGRGVKTPSKKPLTFSDPRLASKVANEWDAQQERIDPMTMPLTRLANTALDGVATDMQAVKEDIVRYSGTDLICYRASGPEKLVDTQRQHWDPMIDFAQSALGCRFDLAEGVMHITQPPESIAAFSTHVGMIDDPLVLAAAHVVTTLTGSATIAMAVYKRELSPEAAWQAAHVDEDFNIEEWGEDHEAKSLRAAKFKDMQAASTVLDILVR